MTEERAELSAEFFRGLVGHLSDLVIVIDAQGGVRYTSDTGLTAPDRGTGPTRADDAARAASFFDLIHPEDRALVDEAITTALDRPGPTIPVEMRAAGRHGWRTLELVAGNLIHDPEVGGVLVAVRDVSRRRRLPEAPSEHSARLRALLDNALQHTPRGGRVRLTLHDEPSRL
ncbi:MAG TPA: PAS domain S-box protein, partial [Acidimicrobiales bacterium]|nr:PAS domain S-box protein [Acidimicrobiales bacterium]